MFSITVLLSVIVPCYPSFIEDREFPAFRGFFTTNTPSCFQLSYVLEDGRHGFGEFHREDLLRRAADQVLRPEAAEGVREMVLDGQVPASRVPEAGPRSRQCSLLKPVTRRVGGWSNILLLEMSIPILRGVIFYRVFNDAWTGALEERIEDGGALPPSPSHFCWQERQYVGS